MWFKVSIPTKGNYSFNLEFKEKSVKAGVGNEVHASVGIILSRDEMEMEIRSLMVRSTLLVSVHWDRTI